MKRALMKASFFLFLASYLALILYWGRDISIDYWDGFLSIMNALSLAGQIGDPPALSLTRPPAGWLILTPVAAWAYERGGPMLALEACHALMSFFPVVLLWVCHKIYSRSFSPGVATVAVVLMACNPLLIRYAPFALFDVFSALAMIPFLWAGYLYLQDPSGKRYGWLLAAYATAVLTRYYFCILVLVPLAYRAFEPASAGWLLRLRRVLGTPLWLLPPMGYLMCVVVVGSLYWWISGGNLADGLLRAHQELRSNFFFNVIGKQAASWSLYIVSLWRQLGPVLLSLMLWGLWKWWSSRQPDRPYLALALCVPLLVMGVIDNKEQRFLLAFLPLIYGAIAQGLEAALSLLSRRMAVRAAAIPFALMLIPWAQSLASVRFLTGEPSVHTQVPWRLARVIEDAASMGGCAGWSNGDIVFHSLTRVIDNDEQMPMLDPSQMRFFTSRRILASGEAAGGGCLSRIQVVSLTRPGPQGGLTGKDALARVYQASPMDPEAGRTLLWEVFVDDIRRPIL